MYRFMTLPTLLTLLLCGPAALPAGEKAGEQPTLIVIDSGGKEHTLKTWKITAGTKRLTWLAPAAADDKGKTKMPAGPEYLEFVEGKTAPLKKGVLTYLPLTSIRSLDFDGAKGILTARVAKSGKEADDEVLTGVTGYVGINIISIEATIDLGELGLAAVKYQGGVDGGVKSIRFATPQPMEPLKGDRIATIKPASKNYPTHKVSDLQVLYSQANGALKTLPTLYFKETVKLDLSKLDKMSQIGSGGGNFDVTIKGGQQTPLVLIDRPKSADGKSELQLMGLLGRFGAGYRLFPMNTVGELHFE